MLAVSTLYNFKSEVATPLVKAMVVAVPKSIAALVLSVALAAVTGFAEELAPEKVKA
ncbi:hypothetical protein AQAU111925_13180 [Aquirufa aurantiipilula]